MSVRWTGAAVQQLRAIHDYIAELTGVRATDCGPSHPPLGTDRGRTVPEYAAPQVREVIEGQYRIIYHIKPDQIDVVAVVHGAQKLD